jgi:hypothetical protein
MTRCQVKGIPMYILQIYSEIPVRVLFCVLQSLYRWRCWGVRDKWSRDTTTDTSGGIFEHDPDICLFHWWSSLLIKRKTSGLRNTLLKRQIIRISELQNVGLSNFAECNIIKNFRSQFCHNYLIYGYKYHTNIYENINPLWWLVTFSSGICSYEPCSLKYIKTICSCYTNKTQRCQKFHTPWRSNPGMAWFVLHDTDLKIHISYRMTISL